VLLVLPTLPLAVVPVGLPEALVVPVLLEFVRDVSPEVSVAVPSSRTLFLVVLEQARCTEPTTIAPAKTKRSVLFIDAGQRSYCARERLHS